MTLEELRRKLRNLMFALDKDKKEMVYTNFEDEVQGVHNVTNVFKNPSVDLAQYRKKVELYIQDHQDQLTIQKLKRNKAITQADLDVLEGLLLEASGMSDVETYREKILQEKPLGTFIRQLVGLDQNAAREAFSTFRDEESYNAEQIQFVDQVIDYPLATAFSICHNSSSHHLPTTTAKAPTASLVKGLWWSCSELFVR